jgi:hypothetical protein
LAQQIGLMDGLSLPRLPKRINVQIIIFQRPAHSSRSFYFCMMKQKIAAAVFLLLTACLPKGYQPDEYLSIQEQSELMDKVIRYVSDLPKGVSHEDKFNPSYNEHYLEQASRHRLDAFYLDSSGNQFLLISRGAPSLTEKRVAIGIKLKLDKSRNISEYEEVFRTWKMKPEVLAQRASYLFDLMVKGESLERYQRNNTSEEWIEFPDGIVYYDRVIRQWKTKGAF